jgi:hypothetical protein
VGTFGVGIDDVIEGSGNDAVIEGRGGNMVAAVIGGSGGNGDDTPRVRCNDGGKDDKVLLKLAFSSKSNCNNRPHNYQMDH